MPTHAPSSLQPHHADEDDDANDYDQANTDAQYYPPYYQDQFITGAATASVGASTSQCIVRVYYSSPECRRFNATYILDAQTGDDWRNGEGEVMVALCSEGSGSLPKNEGVFLSAADSTATKFVLRGEVLEGAPTAKFMVPSIDAAEHHWSLDTRALMTSTSQAFSATLREHFPGDWELPRSKFTTPTYYVNRANHTDMGAAASGLLFRTVKHFVLLAESEPREPTGALLNPDGSFDYDDSYEMRLIPYPLFTSVTTTGPSVLGAAVEIGAAVGGMLFFVLAVLGVFKTVCTVCLGAVVGRLGAVVGPSASPTYGKGGGQESCLMCSCCLPSANARAHMSNRRVQWNGGGTSLVSKPGASEGAYPLPGLTMTAAPVHSPLEQENSASAVAVSSVDKPPQPASAVQRQTPASMTPPRHRRNQSGSSSRGTGAGKLSASPGHRRTNSSPAAAPPSPASPRQSGGTASPRQPGTAPGSPNAKSVRTPASPPTSCPRTGRFIPPI
jgi:hypothetical protein